LFLMEWEGFSHIKDFNLSQRTHFTMGSQTVQMSVGVLSVMLGIIMVTLVLSTGGIDASNEKSAPKCQLIDSNLRSSAMYFTRFCKSGNMPGITGPIIAIGQTVNNKFDGSPSRIGLNLTPREIYKLACVVRCQELDL
jgi:hypothetical protein